MVQYDVLKVYGNSLSHHILTVSVARHLYRSRTLLPLLRHNQADIVFVRDLAKLCGIDINLLLFKLQLRQYIFGGRFIDNDIL